MVVTRSKIHLVKASRTGDAKTKQKVLELLDETRLMTVATLRMDGWPQATMVGYIHDDLTLYFSVARISQKLENIKREPRISIALGHDLPNRLRGLSMAAHAYEVMSTAEISKLNALMLRRYPEQSMFSPREKSCAVIRAIPLVISIVDLARSPGEPELVEVTSAHSVQATTGSSHGGGEYHGVPVYYRHAGSSAYRPEAPS
jgi:general stress protein 26